MTLPLTGVRVMELGGYISAPFGTSMLAALGADVVKIERPGGGDEFRRGKNEMEPYFRQYNAGKRSVAVDIKRPEGAELVRSLVPRFDVVVENMRPGKVDALGLGYEACRAARPDIVYTSVTGFGAEGPMAQRPAYDTIGQAFGGVYSILNPRGKEQLSGTCLADLITGSMTVTGILAALVGRGTTGNGVRVETSLSEAISTLTIDAITQYYADGGIDPDLNSRRPQGQFFVLGTASDESLAVHLSSSQKFWKSFTLVLDRPDLADDPRFVTYAQRTDHYFELVPTVEEIFAKRPAEEWELLLDKHDVPFTPVMTVSKYLDHPQTRLLEMTEPEEDGLALVRPPWRFDGSRPRRSGTTPKVGEHTRQIVREVLDEKRIDDLVSAGVLFAS